MATASASPDLILIDPAFWRGMRVFLTGHTGFIGAWTAFWLAEMGAEVTGFSLEPPTTPSMFEALDLAGLLACHIEADIRDLPAVQAAVKAACPEIALHLAAQPLVRYAHSEPVETFATKCQGTVHVLDSLRPFADTLDAVVCYTTDLVYVNREWVWGYRESDPLGGKEPYGASKAATEHVISAYANAYFQTAAGASRVAVLRAGNVIGGGDWAADRIVPDAIRAFAVGEPLTVRSPQAVRPWQHVLEPVRASLSLAQAVSSNPTRASGAWNIGPSTDQNVPVRQIVEGMVRRWGGSASWDHPPQSGQPYEQTLLAVDSAKARAKLGWSPALTLDQALDLTVNWYKTQQKGADSATLRTLTRMQIAMAAPEVEHALSAFEETIQAS